MSGMKRVVISVAALVLIPCFAALWLLWSAYSGLQSGEFGLAAVSVGISEAAVEAFLVVLLVVLGWWGWTVGRQRWRKSRTE